MPKKANTKYTGFYWYMQAILPDLRRQGRSFSNGLADVVPVARPLWKSLTPQERAKYDDIAKEMKRRDKEAGASNMIQYGDDDRLDNMGNKISDRRNRDMEFSNKRTADQQWTKLRLPDTLEETKDVKFYMIEFEHLLQFEDDYIPLEIGIVEWSMELGISKELHAFIDPGGIPMGYRFKCQNHSDETHKIPIEGFKQAEKDYRGLWQRIVNFVNPGREIYEFPPIYCIKENVENNSVTSQLDWLFRFAGMRGNNPFSRVFVLQDLVKTLSARCGEDMAISDGSANDILTTTMFDYEPNTKCAFHDEQENVNCALGHVKRWAYAMADHFHREEYYDFPLTKKHLPQRTDETSRVTVLEPVLIGSTKQRNTAVSNTPESVMFDKRTSNDGSQGVFASTDIRYRKTDDDLDIKIDDNTDSENDSDCKNHQESILAKHRKQRLDCGNEVLGAWEATATRTKPNLLDEEEFPTLGGGGKKHKGCSPAPGMKVSGCNDDDTSSMTSSGWRPSAKYLEMKHEEEKVRNRQVSLDEVMARRELDDDLSETYVKKREKDARVNARRGGKGRGDVGKSFTQPNNSRPEWNPIPGSSSDIQTGIADLSISRPKGMSEWQDNRTGFSGASHGSACRGSGESQGMIANNFWAGGARRADDGAVRPQSPNFSMLGLGRGRGRGAWKVTSPQRIPGLPSNQASKIEQQSLASRQDEVNRVIQTRHEHAPTYSGSDLESNASAISELSLKHKHSDTNITRPPPGFGRGILRNNSQF